MDISTGTLLSINVGHVAYRQKATCVSCFAPCAKDASRAVVTVVGMTVAIRLSRATTARDSRLGLCQMIFSP